MKKVLFIGNRLNVLNPLLERKDLKIVRVFVLKDSLLHDQLKDLKLPAEAKMTIFSYKDKMNVFDAIEATDFDILISNGCPLIFPVSKIKKPHQLFINMHPTLLPELKGKTPLSGVFMTHQRHIGATLHYLDDGIDTGRVIYQEKIKLTDDLDQGLVYRLSFGLESVAFTRGMDKLAGHNYRLAGTKQQGAGSYFNRTDELQQADARQDKTDEIIDKIRSFGVHTQGTALQLKGALLKVFAAEKMHNDYVLKYYSGQSAGTQLLEYDGRLLVRTIDGVIKLTDYEEVKP